MNKIIFSILFSAITGFVYAQQPKQVKLVSSQLVKGMQRDDLVWVIRPVFAQEGSTLAADSADFNQNANTFDAFGNVVITQPNGTTVYSDVLNYNGNTKLAVLTRNVRLVDGDATLTTDLLTYNLATKIGTYNGGGKIVNGQNILTSKNGYYFTSSRDAYFRYDVILNTPDALITTDTLRYNSNSKIAYFYGPTNIFGKKDSSNLYTENGDYNTQTEQAHFGKKNLYTDGSKSLKGDSLFYDGKAGFGRAIKNITFVDTAGNITFKGDIGIYRKADESILATKNAYVVITTESDSAKVDSIWMAADTLFSKVVLTKSIKQYRQIEMKKDTELDDEPVVKETGKTEDSSKDGKEFQDKTKTTKPGKKTDKLNKDLPPDSLTVPKDTASITPRDTLKAKPPALNKDTAGIAREDTLKVKTPALSADTSKTSSAVKGADKKAVSASKSKKTVKPVKTPADTISNKVIAKPKESAVQDTARSRIVMAYHKAKIFKSDLQAKADSMFFSYSDSTLRCYVNPMIWTQGSQLTGDTVYIQMKNKKLDNMVLQHNGFVVNTESADSANFNQVKGKIITGYFKDSKLSRMFVDGNAESIYYVKDDTTYSGMNHMVSSRIKISLDQKKLKDIISIRKPEGTYYPMAQIPKDENILKGFIWKPKDRPRSKEEIIPGRAAAVKTDTKTPVKKPDKAPPVKPVKKPVKGMKSGLTF